VLISLASSLFFNAKNSPEKNSIYEISKDRIKGQIITGTAEALDGDSLYVFDGKIKSEVRLFGIDAFEFSQTCETFLCGQKAKVLLSQIIKNEIIRCVIRQKDIYDRYVSVCYTQNKADIGRVMVRSGLAVAYRTYSLDYVEDENQAKILKKGAWRHQFQSPLGYRRSN
jgi:endonuclease YncB( thermonuclease family)